MKRRIFYKTRKLMLSTIREEDSEIEDEDTIKENECELKTDQIILKPLETARNIDNFQEKNSEKPENTIKTIKRSKTFYDELSSQGNSKLNNVAKTYLSTTLTNEKQK